MRLTTVRERPLAAAEEGSAVRLALTHDERARSRLVLMRPHGAVSISLPRGTALREGSVLAGDDGALAIIEAIPEPVTRLSARTPLELLRAVYHLANRHVAAQLAADHVLIERDPVLERMLTALGVSVEHVELPFQPEAGAYDAHGHGHSHEEVDEASATIGERLSIAAHRARSRQA